MSNYNEELIGRFCLYQRLSGPNTIAIPYDARPDYSEPHTTLSVIFLKTNTSGGQVGIDHGIDPDLLFPIDISTAKGRTLALDLLRNLARLIESIEERPHLLALEVRDLTWTRK